MFITALTSLRHLSLSWASPIQSIYPHPTSWRFILILSTHLRLGLPIGLLPSGFPTKTFKRLVFTSCPPVLIVQNSTFCSPIVFVFYFSEQEKYGLCRIKSLFFFYNPDEVRFLRGAAWNFKRKEYCVSSSGVIKQLFFKYIICRIAGSIQITKEVVYRCKKDHRSSLAKPLLMWKAISVKYYQCVFVALRTQYAKSRRLVILSYVAFRLFNIFSDYLT